MRSLEKRKAGADRIFASLEGVDADTLEVIGVALRMAGGGLAGFGWALECYATRAHFETRTATELSPASSWPMSWVASRATTKS